MRCIPLFVIASLLVLCACREPPPPVPVPEAPPTPEAPPPVALTPTDAPPPSSPTTAAAPVAIAPLIANGARFQFAFRESADVLKFQTARCTAQANGDAAKVAACLDAIAHESAHEGIRFEKSGEKLEWVSYGQAPDGKEEIYMRAPIALLDAPANELHFRPDGPLTGKQAAEGGFDKLPEGKFMIVKAMDARTLVMEAPPPKGALVFHRQ